MYSILKVVGHSISVIFRSHKSYPWPWPRCKVVNNCHSIMSMSLCFTGTFGWPVQDFLLTLHSSLWYRPSWYKWRQQSWSVFSCMNVVMIHFGSLSQTQFDAEEGTWFLSLSPRPQFDAERRGHDFLASPRPQFDADSHLWATAHPLTKL
jgi:hypothetical protein